MCSVNIPCGRVSEWIYYYAPYGEWYLRIHSNTGSIETNSKLYTPGECAKFFIDEVRRAAKNEARGEIMSKVLKIEAEIEDIKDALGI